MVNNFLGQIRRKVAQQNASIALRITPGTAPRGRVQKNPFALG